MSSIIIGPLIALIPGSVLLLQLEKESLLIFYNSKHRHDMLKSDAKNMIYKYISLIYILGGFFTVVYEYFFGGFSLVNSLILGGIISTIGLILKVTLNSKVSIYKKDNLVCIIISLFITFLMFFLLISGSGTLWPTPFIFMIAFMLYNNSRMIIGISIAIFSSLFVISVIVPYNEVTLNSTDHFLRLFLTFLIAAFAFAVNHFYIAKLKEIEEQYRNVNILNRITKLFSEAKLDEFENSFNYVLSIIGEHFTVDRVYYFTISNNTATFMHEWTNTGIESQKGISYDLKLGFFPWWLNQLETKSYIKIRDVNKLDKEVQVLKKELISKDIKSTLAVPVYRNDEVKGFIGIALNNERREWDSNHITTLTILSNVISNALDKNKAELTVYEMAYLDYLTQLPNRAYLYEQLNLDLKASYFHGFVVGLLDLDDFKSVNDNYGHAAGDDLLQQVALRLNTTKGDNNLVCRFGGDEFLFLFRDIETQEEVKAYGELMIRNFQKPFIIASEEMMIKASFGLFKVEEILDVKTIIAKVDSAMYKAKELGKNQYFIQ